MLPRVVLRLDELIAQADSPLDRECLKAERAGVLARLGLMADARFALAGLRTQSQRHRSPRLNAWVWIVDGLITHFESIGDEARDKFQRAWLQAEAAQDRPMMALSSAWLAVGAFNATDLPALQRHIATALRLAEPAEHATQARVGLVLADAYRFAGDEPSSRRWYLAARSHASADGDSSMISALCNPVERTSSCTTPARAPANAGSSTTKRAPRGVTSSKAMEPLWRSTMAFEIDRPMPVPTPTGLVVK